MTPGNRKLLLVTIFGVAAAFGLTMLLRRSPPTLGLQAVGVPTIQ